MTTEPVKRPASVSFVVFLTWVVALLTILDGILVLFASDATLIEAGVNPNNATTTGWIAIVLGLVIALFASALGKGSGFARLLISLLMVLRLALGIFGMVVLWGSTFFWTALILVALALLVLYLLWNAKAAAWFASR
jgi:hypothetical protein